jgi:hypothetical protein
MSTGAARSLTPRTRKVQGTFQISATLDSNRLPNASARFNTARDLVVRWMNRRVKNELGFSLPKIAWEGQPFEIDRDGQLYAATELAELGLWTARIEHHDSTVAARTWTVDIALRQVGASVIVLQRTLCTSPSDCTHSAPLTVPKIVRDLVREVGMRDVLPITEQPWILSNEADLELLELALADQARRIPVVMLTETDERPRDTYKVKPFVLDPKGLASELLGLAHVVIMPRDLGFSWTKRVGKMWSAFNGAVRTFRPGLSFENDDPYRHPLAKLDDIVMWEYDGVLSPSKLQSEDAFQHFLKEKMFQTIASRPIRSEETLFYRYAKVRSLSAKSAEHAGSSQMEEELRLEIEELKKQAEEERGEKDFAYNYSADLEESIQRLQKERFNLRAQLESLREKLGGTVRAEIPIPDSLEDLEEWQANVTGQLILAPKAIRAASKSDFRDPKLVYQALLLLANEYRQMRIHGGGELRDAYERGLKTLKLTEARSISDARVGEQGEEYYVTHPLDPQRRVLLEDHLKRGTDRDPRNVLRIYFLWDQQEQLVVVGWLPTHLETRNS